MILHQSHLAAAGRCMAQLGYEMAGAPKKTNSAAAYGSVMHHALEVLERGIHELRLKYPDPRDPQYLVDIAEVTKTAERTFVHFWMPANIEAICESVPADGWLPRQGFNELRVRGVETIRKYADLIRFDDHELLALEFGFIVPVDGTWDEDEQQPHWLAGSVDRLAVRWYSRKQALCIDDFKTGQEQTYLRHNLQFTGYCYASTKREFWVGARGEDGFGEERGNELHERFLHAARRGTWINLRRIEFNDAGYRGERDYRRFALACDQLAASIKADIFPLTLTGKVCQYCDFREVCGGLGIATEKEGAPA